MAAPGCDCPYCSGNELMFKQDNVKLWVDGGIRLFDPKSRVNATIDVLYCPMCGKEIGRCRE